ncbi:glycoside hydrolase family 32 protein [Gracilibacillus alcaliphilus]|uniref:glycoside hydrolase family 32 protein n=1 Tax=Gracilibacillus alcaliphilus TaxID=1401441 RepID=UPI0019590ED5|nr:glycoside hydrolase family 32 protein [Gracilibacillus alcaliphilus]MBM7677819.1 fructan beta-fructosidase [Gracilibacillus alcaliphilus]
MYYQETLRPQIHFTPKENWINDPNGLVYYEGEYHLFYQRNPNGNKHADMHWGHAVSTDLYHWKELGTALEPDQLGTIFSGSAVVDKHNTSGLFKEETGGLVAIFTHDNHGEQQQSIAYSEDKGRTWVKYEGNPVIPNTTIKDFRDPKVAWHADSKQWVMVLACGDHIQFFGSPNLIDWTHLSSFGKEYPSDGGVWECPDLIHLPVEGTDQKEWVLIVSINPGGPNGGSAVYYFTGSFDGKEFHPNEAATDPLKWADEGRDFYAAVTWDNTDDTYWIGWMNNWDYANDVPVSPWRSAMSLVRKISLQPDGGNYLLKQEPVIVSEPVQVRSESSLTIKPGEKAAYDVTLPGTIDIQLSQPAKQWGFQLVSDQGEVFKLEINQTNNSYTFYRTEGQQDFSDKFASEITGSLNGLDIQKITAIFDHCSFELFANDGVVVSTNLMYPSGAITAVELYTEEAEVEVEQLSMNELPTIWK